MCVCVCAEWSREMLLEAWMEDPIACCDKCGVVPPSSVICDRPAAPPDTTVLEPQLTTPTSQPQPAPSEIVVSGFVNCASKPVVLGKMMIQN